MADYSITRTMLESVPLPAQTRTYKPIGHGQIIDVVSEGIVKAGFSIERELYSAAKEGDVATGRYFIKGVEDSEMQLQITWQNSYNKSKRLTFAIGANVLVCTNGMIGFRGINSFKKRHIGEIQTFAPTMIPEAIKAAGEMFKVLQSDREMMKQIEISDKVRAELIGRMYIEQNFIESTQLNIIKREIEHPTHDYNSKSSLWELYQFTTFAIGGIHPSRWMDDHLDAHDFFIRVMQDLSGIEPIQPISGTIPVEDTRQLKLFEV